MPDPSKPRRRSPKATPAAPDAGPFTAELLASAPAAPVRPPASARTTNADTATSLEAKAKADALAVPRTYSDANREGTSRPNASETRFDDIVDFHARAHAQFDALASAHPRSSVLISLALGLVAGLVLGYFVARD